MPVHSAKQLAQLGNVNFEPRTPLRLYFRSADLVLKQARIYDAEKDYENAYVLYFKYSNLGLTHLPTHPDYKNPQLKRQANTVKKNCLEALDALERIKPIIDRQYALAEKERKQKDTTQAAARRPSNTPRAYSSEYDLASRSDVAKVPTDEKSEKVWSLQDELRGVPGVAGSTTQSYFPPQAADEKTEWYPPALTRNESDALKYESGKWQEDEQYKQELEYCGPQPPALPAKIPHHYIPMPMPMPSPPLVEPRTKPGLPPKFNRDAYRDIPAQPKPLAGPAIPPKEAIAKPSIPTQEIQVATERGMPLRRLLVPKTILSQFLSVAQTDTNKNLETCGILSGTLKSNVFTITTLIIPKQTATSDTCSTTNEEELFDYQDQHDLLTLGWIHASISPHVRWLSKSSLQTHPTQSCFLSSVDLHTHCSYQLMLPEAIAIVCAPRHNPSYGVFRLTDPPGIDVISNCTQKPTFHPHPDLPIYTDAMSMGHVQMRDMPLKVIDIRKS